MTKFVRILFHLPKSAKTFDISLKKPYRASVVRGQTNHGRRKRGVGGLYTLQILAGIKQILLLQKALDKCTPPFQTFLQPCNLFFVRQAPSKAIAKVIIQKSRGGVSLVEQDTIQNVS